MGELLDESSELTQAGAPMVVGAGGRGVAPLTIVLEGHLPLGSFARGGACKR